MHTIAKLLVYSVCSCLSISGITPEIPRIKVVAIPVNEVVCGRDVGWARYEVHRGGGGGGRCEPLIVILTRFLLDFIALRGKGSEWERKGFA